MCASCGEVRVADKPDNSQAETEILFSNITFKYSIYFCTSDGAMASLLKYYVVDLLAGVAAH